MKETINCAHRGASSRAPENTIAALELAAGLGASMAEIDIQQTVDDQLVLFHDDELERTSSGAGPLWQHTLAQLKQLDAGSWFSSEFTGECIPTLEEAATAMRGRLGLNIELKMHGHERDLAVLVASHLQRLDCLDWCLVSSFDHGVVDELKRLLPQLKNGYIVGRHDWNDDLPASPVSVLSLEKSLVTEERIQKIHGAGKEVHVWTVNEVPDMVRLQKLGVDAIIGNYPDRMAKIRF